MIPGVVQRTEENIFRLEVTMADVLGVQVLDSGHHLVKVKFGLKTKQTGIKRFNI